MAPLHRRTFLRRSGVFAATPLVLGAAPKGATATLVLDGNDAVASARPVLQAMHALQLELTHAGYTVKRALVPQQGEGLCIIASGSRTPLAAGALASARATQPVAAESLALFEASVAGHPAVVACAADARGLTYAIYELVDRVRCRTPLKFPTPVVEQPANPVRSIMRQFTCETYDKLWFYDRAMWPQYLSMLAANRFNRLDLAFGLSYDMLVDVTDSYFLFAYPFLVSVPGYDVHVTNLSDGERIRNLAALRYISDQAVAHGLDFQLGLWMHGYELKNSPAAKYLVTGLTPENHAAYCRDALTTLLKALPAVSSVGLRIHGESGVAEGSYDFWKTVFDGVVRCGRKVEIDLHAKGIDDTMIENALTTGMPVNLSPKFAAEHMGLPYHQADIRPSEIPAPGVVGSGLMTLSAGQRSFTRYGYADLMREDRKYTVRTRVFYGTQRILASGNAQAAAAYSRAFQFCGTTGADLMEPLTFRGRRGTAVSDSPRDGYAARKLAAGYDWQKYDYWYRTFGRMMFNPETDAAAMRRVFGSGQMEQAVCSALDSATLILPLVTQAHSVSAACDIYWPEICWNMPMASEAPALFFDTPSPKTFQNVTALDPQLFSSCSGFAGELLGERSGKYSPLDVAAWLENLSGSVQKDLARARSKTTPAEARGPNASVLRRLIADAEMQAFLGLYFAAKLRSGVYLALFEQTGDKRLLEEAVRLYESARGYWANIIDPAEKDFGGKTIYAGDLSIGDRFTEHGQWTDRLTGIDSDIATLKAKLAAATDTADPRAGALVDKQPWSPMLEPLPCTHTAPATFTAKHDVALELAVARPLTAAKLWYRHVNQAERWTSVDMAGASGTYRASIPAAYTDSPYPLQYYVEFHAAPDKAWLYPGFTETLLNQPYFVLWRSG